MHLLIDKDSGGPASKKSKKGSKDFDPYVKDVEVEFKVSGYRETSSEIVLSPV